MKQDTDKILKQIEREERLRNIVPVIWIALILLAIFTGIFLFQFSSGKTTNVYGVITGLNGVPIPKLGEIPHLIITLDTGKVVQVKKPNGVLYKKNQRVQLVSTKTSIIGNVRYEFKSYVNE
jgi:hypothetical protein